MESLDPSPLHPHGHSDIIFGRSIQDRGGSSGVQGPAGVRRDGRYAAAASRASLGAHDTLDGRLLQPCRVPGRIEQAGEDTATAPVGAGTPNTQHPTIREPPSHV